MARCTRFNICDKVCQCLATGQGISPDTPVSSTNKIGHHDITEILLKMALSAINLIISKQITINVCFNIPPFSTVIAYVY